MRGKSVTRVLIEIQMLSFNRFGKTVKELKDGLYDRGIKVSERTLYRDLNVIESAGFILIKSEDNSRFQIQNNSLPPVLLK